MTTTPINEIKVGDTYRLKAGETFRIWKVVGVFLGATGAEDTVGLKTLDKKNGSAYGVEIEQMLMPISLFAAAECERC